MRFTSLASFTPDLHEFHSVSGYGVNLQDISNAWGVEFVFEEVGFQGRGFLRFQAAVERPSRTLTDSVRLSVSAKSSALPNENS